MRTSFLVTQAAVVSVTLGILVVSTTAPALGPAWHFETAWGHLAGTTGFRIAMVSLAVVALQAAAFGWRALRRGERAACLLAALLPVLVAASPAPELSTDSTLLRSPDPVADLAATGGGAAADPHPTAPPGLLVDLLLRPGERTALIALTEAIYANSTPNASAEEDAEVKELVADVEALKAGLAKVPKCLSIDSGEAGVDYLNIECLREEKRIGTENAKIKKKIAKLETRIALRRGVLAQGESDRSAALGASQQGLLAVIDRIHVVIWSRLAVTAVVALAILFMLFFPAGSWVLLGVPVVTAAFAMTPLPVSADTGMPAGRAAMLAGLAVVEVLLVAAAAARAFVLDNADFWGRMRSRRVLRLLLKSAVFWLPLGAIVGAATLLNGGIHEAELRLAYGIALPEESGLAPDASRCEPDADPSIIYVREPFCPQRDLERDIRTSTTYWFTEASTVARGAVGQSKVAADRQVDEAVNASLTLFEQAIPNRLGTQNLQAGQTGVSAAFNYKDDCFPLDFKCRIWREIAIALDGRYMRSRSTLKSSLESELRAGAEASGTVTAASANTANASILTASEWLKAETSRQVFLAFRLSEVLSAVSMLIAAIAIFKSYGFMTGRTAFADPSLNRRISMGQARHGDKASPSVSISDQGGLPLRTPGRYRIRYGAHVDGKAPKGLLPYQPLRQTMARLIPFRHAFQFFDFDPGEQQVSLPCGNVRRIIEIRLGEGERVGYFPKYLYGVVGNPRLNSRWTLRIGNLLQGRMRLHLVEGPGSVLLMSTDQPSLLSAGNEGSGGLAPSRLMAWSEGLDLKVTCESGWLSAYTSPVLLQPVGAGFALFDGPTGRNRFGGALTFVPTLLLPL
ncbi:hypothetical protein [Defluviimonas salinarum]|uniref:Uncharacterized protein n=1 Tax=Defluviimonas salinarum TaxID=2992147 RepID=A0ABT3J7F7_9RHOB|nr:hypothetical protein [Defluviimonas salinarum]MCW3783596.1 hypothetical protein [Defluviimonas salinarum]